MRDTGRKQTRVKEIMMEEHLFARWLGLTLVLAMVVLALFGLALP